jgi:DnaK suppressor protein
MVELSDRETGELRSALLKLRDELAAMLASTAEAVTPVDLEQPIGRLSRMDAMQQQSMAVANRRSAQIRHQQVDAALERIEADEYGDCLDCGEAVDPRRLAAYPETPFCFACKSIREQRR